MINSLDNEHRAIGSIGSYMHISLRLPIPAALDLRIFMIMTQKVRFNKCSPESVAKEIAVPQPSLY